MMKFALNHSYKFRSWKWAFVIGSTQCLMVVCVEIVNVYILCTAMNVMEIIMDFLALVVISEFDNFFVETLKTDPVFHMLVDNSDTLKEALKISVTTSDLASANVQGNMMIEVNQDLKKKFETFE